MSNREMEPAIDAAKQAGEIILGFYKRGLTAEHKRNRSPLTQVDRAAHDIISALLKPTGLSVVSEEGDDLCPLAEKYGWVDPLAGTKNFLAGNNEFIINTSQAMLEAAGGQVLVWDTAEPLRYGKSNRRNTRLLSPRAPNHPDDFELQPNKSEMP
jgi:3'-phosphoadenosine 5'-phosphosulfate (PAPS) 3'-phosphatase